MSRLTEKDLALLKARGKVKSLTTERDFEMPSWDKPKPKGKKAAPAAKKPEAKKHELIGKLLHTSWGYDMTINDFCKIIEVSPTGKTVKCRMVSRKVDGDPWHPCGNGKAKAGSNVFGPVFRLKVGKGWNDNPSFHGSYPYCVRDDEKWSAINGRKGYFSITSADTEYYENRCD